MKKTNKTGEYKKSGKGKKVHKRQFIAYEQSYLCGDVVKTWKTKTKIPDFKTKTKT